VADAAAAKSQADAEAKAKEDAEPKACPWLYVHDGKQYVKKTEVLKNIVGLKNKTTTSFILSPNSVVDGAIRIRLQEEKDEITHLDRCVVKVTGVEIAANCANSDAAGKLAAVDRDDVILKKGDAIDLEFTLPWGMSSESPIVLETNGFYDRIPLSRGAPTLPRQ
jgi:hypothetical protein